MFTNRDSAAFLRVRRSPSRLAGVHAVVLAAGLACASSAFAQPGKDKDDGPGRPVSKMPAQAPSQTPRAEPPRAAPRTPSVKPSTPAAQAPAPRAQPAPAPKSQAAPAQPQQPAPRQSAPAPAQTPAPKAEPTRPSRTESPAPSRAPSSTPAQPPAKAPTPAATPVKPSTPPASSPSVKPAPGPKVVDVTQTPRETQAPRETKTPRDNSTPRETPKPRDGQAPRDTPVRPGTPALPNSAPGSSVKPANTTGGFKPAGPAPRVDVKTDTRSDPRGGGVRNANFIPSAPMPADSTRRVSDRATRFSQVDGAAPLSPDSRSRGGRHDSWNSRGHGSHDDYWDGYRDGYRRGYRNGYRDGFWDDCWYPSWRHHSHFGLWFSSGCWSGWSVSIGWGSSGCGWYTPSYHHYYTPVWYYRPLVSYTTVTTSTWDGSSTVTTTYNSAPGFDVVDFCDEIAVPATIVYQPTLRTVASGPRVVEVELPSFQPTLYRSDDLAGTLGWNDSPEAVAAAVGATGPTDRADAAARFLGRIPAGGWDVGYEGDRVVDGRRELLFRGLAPNPRGQRVLIVLLPGTAAPKLYPGQRVQITGRLAEICIDDPFEQAGRLILADGSVRN